MDSPTAQVLEKWLKSRLDQSQWQWLQAQFEKLKHAPENREAHIAFGLIPRKLGRKDLLLDAAELIEASAARTNWQPTQWSVDIAARQLLLCQFAANHASVFDSLLLDMCRTADLSESIALYSGICLYPQSDTLNSLVGEGLRTNVRAIFQSIAHRNPYPSESFDQNRWNHMVLKALFIDIKLAPIQGLDHRANAELAAILIDYAHERWAAGRVVTPELWRCVGPFANAATLDDLKQLAASDREQDRQAAALAFSECPDSAAREVLKSLPDYVAQVASGKLTWDSMASGENS